MRQPAFRWKSAVLLTVGIVGICAALWEKRRLYASDPGEYVGPFSPPAAHVAIVGETPPPAVLHDLAGIRVALGGKAPRPRLIHFWASWCLPCVAELPSFEAAQHAFAAQGFDLVTVAMDDHDHAQEVVDRLHLTIPVLISDGATEDPAMAMGSRQGSIPFNVVLDPNGTVRRLKVGTMAHGAEGTLIWIGASGT